MKKELIKETKPNGDVFYSIEIDGMFVSGSVERDEKKAIALFEAWPVHKESREVLKTIEI